MIVHQGFRRPVVRVRVLEPGSQRGCAPSRPGKESSEIAAVSGIGDGFGTQTVLCGRFRKERVIVALQSIKRTNLGRREDERVGCAVIPIGLEIGYGNGSCLV